MRLDLSRVLTLVEQYLTGKAYSRQTIKRYRYVIKRYFMWMRDARGKEDLRDVSRNELADFLEYCAAKGYSTGTRQGVASNLTVIYRYLVRNELLLANPFDGMDIRIVKRHKIRETLSVDEINEFLDGLNMAGAIAIQERCLFELMYGNGLRVNEVVWLDVTDVDIKEGKIFVRKGKGRRERVIPIGSNVLKHIKVYLEKSRSILVKKVKDNEDGKALFISRQGVRLGNNTIGKRFVALLKKAGLWRKGLSPHVLRHTFATHMLENGASLAHVKALLGHKSLQTTVIYTHMSEKSLKKIIRMYHPRENELYEEIRIKKDEVRALKD
jgi:site-specific recombinase XerD